MLINNEKIRITFTKEECEELLNYVKEVFYEVNSIISKISGTHELILNLANPSPEVCQFCNFRPVCISYWEARKKIHKEIWPLDLKGKTVGKGLWGYNRIYLDIEDEEKKIVKVVDLLPERYPALEVPNHEIAFFSLNKDTKNARIFHEGQLTVAYPFSQNIYS